MVRPESADVPAVVLVYDGERAASLYCVTELPRPSLAFRQFEMIGIRRRDALTENAVRRYQVLLHEGSETGDPQGDCTCAAGTFKGHIHCCRHIAALAALWKGGKL